jgi:hypothetical protein
MAMQEGRRYGDQRPVAGVAIPRGNWCRFPGVLPDARFREWVRIPWIRCASTLSVLIPSRPRNF